MTPELVGLAESPDRSGRERFGRVGVDRLSARDAAELIIDRAADRLGGDVHLINAYTVSLAGKDADYATLLNAAWLNLADGRSLQAVSRVRHSFPATRQIRGKDLMYDVLSLGRERGIRHFLLGSTSTVLTELRASIEGALPGVLICGCESPPFRDLTDAERNAQVELIRSCEADIVWVGLGTPKQDMEAAWLAEHAGVTAIAVGAAFDFLAGSKREAPKLMRRFGLEWMFRLMLEPRRLWRRYLAGNLRFLIAVARSDRS